MANMKDRLTKLIGKKIYVGGGGSIEIRGKLTKEAYDFITEVGDDYFIVEGFRIDENNGSQVRMPKMTYAISSVNVIYDSEI